MTALLVMVLAAAPATDAPRLVVLDLQRVGAATDAEATLLTDAVVEWVSKAGVFQVVSQRDIQTLLGVERQKQLVGCGEDATNCMAELSGALNARFVLSGQVNRLGGTVQLTLQTLDTQKSQPVGRSLKAAKSAEDLRAIVPWAVAEATGTPPPKPPSRTWPTVMMVAGGVALLGGGVIGFVALTQESSVSRELKSATPGHLNTADYYSDAALEVRERKTLALILMSVGAGLLAGGISWWFSLPDVGLGRMALIPTGPGLSLAGSF
jgi:TolB-like protein